MPLPEGLARFNRRGTNKVTGLFAGWLPGFAILIHRGRRSGREYRTPINTLRQGNDYLFACTYGPDRDWVKNVLAAGSCDLLRQGRRIHLINPRLVSDPTLAWAPIPVRPILRRIGVSFYLRMTCATGGSTPV